MEGFPYEILEEISIAAIPRYNNPHVFKNTRYYSMYSDDEYI